jgi:hypothetical protein
MVVLDQIPVTLTIDEVMGRLRNQADLKECAAELLARVRTVARPKAAYAACFIEEKSHDGVTIDGVRFTSRVLRTNLDPVGQAFPFVATCGVEVDTLTVDHGDVMAEYCLDLIKRMLVQAARASLEAHVTARYALGQISRMSPGSLQDWPITEQQPLFALLGDVEAAIGVRLTDSLLMVPVKSVSGLMFPTEAKFESCRLCPRPVCEGRRAPYDPAQAARYQRPA